MTALKVPTGAVAFPQWLLPHLQPSRTVLEMGLVIEVREEILRQVVELRRKQETRLAAQQHRSAILGGAAITVAALISAVPAKSSPPASSPCCWPSPTECAGTASTRLPPNGSTAPNIDKLTKRFSNRNDGHRALLDHLIAVHNDHHGRNELAVNSARRIVAIQVIATFVALSLLVGALLALG